MQQPLSLANLSNLFRKQESWKLQMSSGESLAKTTNKAAANEQEEYYITYQGKRK